MIDVILLFLHSHGLIIRLASCSPGDYSIQLVEKWFGVLGTPAAAAVKDLNLYQEQVGKIEQAEMVSPLFTPPTAAEECRLLLAQEQHVFFFVSCLVVWCRIHTEVGSFPGSTIHGTERQTLGVNLCIMRRYNP